MYPDLVRKNTGGVLVMVVLECKQHLENRRLENQKFDTNLENVIKPCLIF